MNTEMDKKEFVIDAKNSVQTEKKLPSQLVECTGDFVLPDYMPKVQKVLRIEARALPPTRYVSANSVQMSGDVLHTLIYLGEDGESGATVLPAKYEFSIPIDTLSSPTVTACVQVEGLSYRITAPRKLNIHTRLSAKPSCFEREDVTPTIIPKDAEINKLFGEISGLKTTVLHSIDAEVSDRIEIGSAKEARLLWCGATAAITDARVTEGGVSIRGEIFAKVLSDSDGEIKMYTKKMPFDELLEGEVNRGSAVNAVAHVISTEAVKESENEASLDISFYIEATVDEPVTVAVLKDAFSSEVPVENTSRDVINTRLVMSKSGIYTVGASIAKAAAGAEAATLVTDTSGKAVVEEISAENGHLTVSGRCELSSIFAEENGLFSADYGVPFTVSVDCENTDGIKADAVANLLNARVRTEGEMLVCDIDIALALRAVKESTERVLSAVDCTSKEKYKSSTYPLCLIYPNGESLWELAKKYHVNPVSLASVNSLDISESEYANREAMAGQKLLMLELK